MKKFTITCDFNGIKAPFTVYIGSPQDGHHPLHFQSEWLSKERGGVVPPEVMDSLSKLKDLADKNNVSFEELCVYTLGSAQASDDQYEETGSESADYSNTDEGLGDETEFSYEDYEDDTETESDPS